MCSARSGAAFSLAVRVASRRPGTNSVLASTTYPAWYWLYAKHGTDIAAMCGTDVGYPGANALCEVRYWQRRSVSSYALAMQCPVLTYGVWCYQAIDENQQKQVGSYGTAMRCPVLSYAMLQLPLPICYAMSGTELSYATATSTYLLCDVRYLAVLLCTTVLRGVLRDVQY
eukprot:547062-Rhodomonas_salina.2